MFRTPSQYLLNLLIQLCLQILSQSKACLSTVDIPPILKERPKLTLVRCTKTTITPRPVDHPAIINACEAMFSKHPSKLIPEEDPNWRTLGVRSHLLAHRRYQNLCDLWRIELNCHLCFPLLRIFQRFFTNYIVYVSP